MNETVSMPLDEIRRYNRGNYGIKKSIQIFFVGE